jgi:hypothetical protein
MTTKQYWHPSKTKPANVCRFVKGVGVITIFPARDGFKFVYDSPTGKKYSDSYDTQENAQLAVVAELQMISSAQRADAEESNTMEETAPAQAPEYASNARLDKLITYVNTLVREHNDLCAKVEALTAQVKELSELMMVENRLPKYRQDSGKREILKGDL